MFVYICLLLYMMSFFFSLSFFLVQLFVCPNKEVVIWAVGRLSIMAIYQHQIIKDFFFINSSLIASFSFFLFPFRFSLTSFSCCFFWGGGGACCFYFLLFHSLLSRFAFFRLCYLMNFYNCRTCLQAGEVIASLLKDAARSSLFLP